MKATMVVTMAALLLVLACGGAHALDWADLASNVGAAELLDGSGTVTMVSWPLCEADFDTQVLNDRRLWLDALDPAGTLGGGVSLDVTPGGPAALGVGYRDGWVGYFGGHVEVDW